jgi:hypothetical protein
MICFVCITIDKAVFLLDLKLDTRVEQFLDLVHYVFDRDTSETASFKTRHTYILDCLPTPNPVT